MKKWVCPVCGYVHEGDTAPEKCPQCGVAGSKFTEQKADMTWAAEHVVGVAKGVDQEILDGLLVLVCGGLGGKLSSFPFCDHKEYLLP